MKTILIVDDIDILRRYIVRYLQRFGFTVFQAKSLQQAIDITNEQQIDVVITDYDLDDPQGTGMNLVRLLKASGHDYKIAIMSSYIEPVESFAIEMGIRYIQKDSSSNVGSNILQFCQNDAG